MMRRQGKHRRPERRGAILVWVGLTLIPLLLIIGFAIDIGYIMSVRAELQNAADAAAVAGATHLLYHPGGGASAAIDRARSVAAANTAGFIHPVLRTEDVTFPAGTGVVSGTAVKVIVHRDTEANGSLVLFFGSSFQERSSPLGATATAILEDSGGGTTPNRVRLR